MRLQVFLWSLCALTPARASVTVWSQQPMAGGATNTGSAAAANYTGAAAYDPTVLNAPGLPDPAPANTFFLQLGGTNTTQGGLSIALAGTFFGFSIEMSVVNQIIGINSTFIQVPFLNLLANIKERAGGVHIRVGGNTQETAWMVDSLPNNTAITKFKGDSTNPTQTPATVFTEEMIYMMSNVSSLVGAKWYLGVPMNDTKNLRLQIAEKGEAILGDNLLGLQVGNEPDLYGRHGMGGRPDTYSEFDYFGEFGEVMNAINNDANIPVKNNIIGPSVSASQWSPDLVFSTGYIEAYTNNLMALSVEHYPDDNCFAQFGGAGSPKVVQDEFSKYLDHTAGQNLIKPFLNASATAQAAGKPFLMFETNTASCGGFPGISNSFGAALWGLDYGLQMAFSNFSGALLHIGGQNVYYNPFTPPPTNQSSFHRWTVGPIYYAPLIISEALGSTGAAQVVDLGANNGNVYTPAYAIYEQGNVARVALFNFMTDGSGAHTYTASIAVGGGTSGQPNGTPASVKVKYLSASNVNQKDNITWAGQGFGSHFESDGRISGDLNIQTINCADNVCQVQVPAPGFALVFLTDSALTESTPKDALTFSTSAFTKTHNTVTIDPSMLATSNGHSGAQGRGQGQLGSTSKEKVRSGASPAYVPSVMAFVAFTMGALIVRRQVR